MYQARGLTISSLVIGSIGFALFVYPKLTGMKGPYEKYLLMASKLLVALGVFLLAGAVLDLATPHEFYVAKKHQEDDEEEDN